MSINLDAERVKKAVGGKLIGENRPVEGVSIDSRTVKEGDLFVAIKGSKFDAHDFVIDAFEKGAIGALVGKEIKPPEGKFCVVVEDTFEALWNLGKFQRDRFKGTVVGIAGSAGKTTTKELVYHLLSSVAKAYRSPGNLNSKIGLPLVLANLPLEVEFAVVELGASQLGDVKRLTKLSKPRVRVITAVGEEHLETFGNLENVIKGNGEIFEGFGEKDYAVIPAELKGRYSLPKEMVITFGNGGDIYAEDVSLSLEGVRFTYNGVRFTAPVLSRAIVKNVIASFGVLKALGYKPENFKESLANFKGVEGRMQVKRKGRVVFIDDTYNANPLSVKNALKTLSELDTKGKKIAVLGDMLELGDYSRKLHEEVGRFLKSLNLDLTVFYGEEMEYAYKESLKFNVKSVFFKNKQDLIKFLLKECRAGNIILFKGSRGMRMEKLLLEVMERVNDNA